VIFHLDQRIHYEYDRPVSDLRQRLVIVPPEVHGTQQRLDWAIRVDGVERSHRRARQDAFGNTVVELSIPRVHESVTFTLVANLQFGDTAAPVVSSVRPYLMPTRLTEPDDRIRALAQAAKDGGAEAISAAVRHALRYEWGVTGVWTTGADALAAGAGVCQDFAHVMVSACRMAGIPARYVSGHLMGEGGTHAWVEVLAPAAPGSPDWVASAWDPTHDCRTDDRYVTVAVGRDYADVAPMSGTYRGEGIENRLTAGKTLAAA